MRLHKLAFLFLLAGAKLALTGCSSATTPDPEEPAFSALLFSAGSARVDNTYLPLVPDTVHVYQVDGEDGIEIVVVEVLDSTRMVAGVECTVVRDRVYLEELLIEETYDWYAQDDEGNVWYMGEEVTNYEYDDDGNVIATDCDGAWEAGRDVAGTGDLAEPGIVMKAVLAVGDSYRQEYYPGEAEDMGKIVARNVSVTLSDDSTHTCLKTRDWNPLEPGVAEYKYYAPGIGLVLEEITDGSEPGELKGIFHVGAGSLPDFGAASFSNPSRLTNSYLSFPEETAVTFVTETEDGVETIVVELQDTTRMVNGIECAVVRDRVFLDDLLIEDTHDWYAQDDSGNVWYMGEDVTNYEYDDDGNLTGTDHDGAWEAGVDDAEPGILMWASPQVGRSYRQEFYEDEAEDMALVIALDVTVDLTDGTSHVGCLRTLEWTPVEPYALEYKSYARNAGVVMEEPLDGSEAVELAGAFDLSDSSLPDFSAATFTAPTQITNSYLPFTQGDRYEYESDTDDGLELVVVEVLAAPRLVNGIQCRVVRVREYLDSVLMEDTHDWYAQDDGGNVWYMGESVDNYEYDDQGNFLGIAHDGAWEAGVDGAEPGVLMWASPQIGRSYQQEYYEDEAEDMGRDIAVGVTVELSDGTTYTGCLKVLEWTPLEPETLEYNYYAPGVGVVLEEPARGGEPTELTDAP